MEFGLSDYYVIGELITCWGSFLICVNTILSYVLYDRSQRFFLYAALSTFFASMFNMISVYNITHFTEHSHFALTLVTTLYFFSLLICPFFMTTYCNSKSKGKKDFLFNYRNFSNCLFIDSSVELEDRMDFLL